MAGQPNRRDRAKREANQNRHRELKALRDQWVKEGVVQHGVSPEQALQRVIDDSTFRYLTECKINDDRRDAGEIVSDRRERNLAKDVAYYTTLAMQYNIADRQTKVQEGRLVLMLELLQRACRHPDINLPYDKVKLLPRIMKDELAALRQGDGPQRVAPVIPHAPEDL
jgi:hypothetical protein